jgi:hypothetical protein
MDNVLENVVQRLRAIELLLRTQNELLTRVLAELEQIRHSELPDRRDHTRKRESSRRAS